MNDDRQIITTDDALQYLKFIRNKKQEYVICLSLDSGDRLIARRTVTIGLLSSCLVHPREIFSGPLKDRAAAIIIAHNHPSGSAEPSKQDVKVTNQLVAAAQLLGITFRDHIIVTRDSYFSFRKERLL